MNIPLNNLSGYDNMNVNAGNIQNTGIEIILNARPNETTQFSWDTTSAVKSLLCSSCEMESAFWSKGMVQLKESVSVHSHAKSCLLYTSRCV